MVQHDDLVGEEGSDITGFSEICTLSTKMYRRVHHFV